MIEGCLDWQANGLLKPASVLAATEEYFSDQDLFAHWLAEECDLRARQQGEVRDEQPPVQVLAGLRDGIRHPARHSAVIQGPDDPARLQVLSKP